jgi:hypothetical protein
MGGWTGTVREEEAAMPEPKIEVVVKAEGRTKAGVFHPTLGTKVEARFADAGKAKIEVDYRDPDSLRITVAGDLSMRGIGMRNVRLGGELEREMFTGRNEFHGSVSWKIPKNVAVEVTTGLSKTEQRVGAKVTLKF